MASEAAIDLGEGPEQARHHFRKYFSDLILDLLEQLAVTFEECARTSELKVAYETYIKDNESAEGKMIKKWHDVMHPYYRQMVQNPLGAFDEALDVLMRNRENTEDLSLNDLIGKVVVAKMQNRSDEHERLMSLIYDPVYFLKQMKMKQKWHDPTFDDESRRYLVCYMLHLNGFAMLHDMMFDGVIAEAQKAGMGVAQKLMDDPSNSGDVQSAILSDPGLVMRETCSQLPQGQMESLMKHMPTFLLAISSLSGAGLEGGNMLLPLLNSDSHPFAQQLGPMKDMLNMVIPYLDKIPPNAFQNITDVMQSPMFQTLMSSMSNMNLGGGEGGPMQMTDAFNMIMQGMQGGQGAQGLNPDMLQNLMRPELMAAMMNTMQQKQ